MPFLLLKLYMRLKNSAAVTTLPSKKARPPRVPAFRRRTVSPVTLKSGDVLETAIGRAPIKTIEPRSVGYDVVLDITAEGSTRPAAQGSVLFLYRVQSATILVKS